MNKMINKMINKTINKIKKMDIQLTLIFILVLLLLYYVYQSFHLNEAFETSCKDLPNKLKSNDKQLVLFFADWCGHCKKIKPDWEEVSKQVGHDKMLQVNVGNGTEEEKTIMNEYDVKGFPTIIIFENGKPKGPFESRDKDSLLNFFSSN